MAEELQSLLDKIQSEGVAKAEARAAEIVAEAERTAAAAVAGAGETVVWRGEASRSPVKLLMIESRSSMLCSSRGLSGRWDLWSRKLKAPSWETSSEAMCEN